MIDSLFDPSTLMSSRFAAIREHLFSELKGEGVILSLKTGKYYGVNEVGRFIWSRIQNPATFGDIQTALLNEYDVDEETGLREIAKFLTRMAEEELVDIINENAD